jgi:hypothetical protein
MKSLRTLEGALEFIREVDPVIRKEANCFLALTGGVLIKGESTKDLDLVLLPMNSDKPANRDRALGILEARLGPSRCVNFNSNGAPRQEFQPLTFHLFRDRGEYVDLIVQQ